MVSTRGAIESTNELDPVDASERSGSSQRRQSRRGANNGNREEGEQQPDASVVRGSLRDSEGIPLGSSTVVESDFGAKKRPVKKARRSVSGSTAAPAAKVQAVGAEARSGPTEDKGKGKGKGKAGSKTVKEPAAVGGYAELAVPLVPDFGTLYPQVMLSLYKGMPYVVRTHSLGDVDRVMRKPTAAQAVQEVFLTWLEDGTRGYERTLRPTKDLPAIVEKLPAKKRAKFSQAKAGAQFAIDRSFDLIPSLAPPPLADLRRRQGAGDAETKSTAKKLGKPHAVASPSKPSTPAGKLCQFCRLAAPKKEVVPAMECTKCHGCSHLECLARRGGFDALVLEREELQSSFLCPRCRVPETDDEAKYFTPVTQGPCLVGLLNVGSTCYISSAVQLIALIPGLVESLYSVMADPVKVHACRLADELVASEAVRAIAASSVESGAGRRTSTVDQAKVATHVLKTEEERDWPATFASLNDDLFDTLAEATSWIRVGAVRLSFSFLKLLKGRSGAAMSTKYLTNEHQDMNEYLMQSLEVLHDKLRERGVKDGKSEESFYASSLASLLPARPDTAAARELKRSLLDKTSQVVREPRLVYPERAAQLTHDAWSAYLERECSPVVNALDGMLTRVRVCPHGHSSHSFETFRIFSLNFAPSGAFEQEAQKMAEKAERDLQRIMGQDDELHDRPPPKRSLARFFDQLQLPEFVELKCEQCGEAAGDQRFVQVSYISRFPRVLMLHLARFRSTVRSTWGAQKIHVHVDFPVNGLTFRQSNGESIVYDLVAVVNHSGSFSKGHYYAYVRPTLVTGVPTTSQWYKLDDHTVSPVSSVVTPKAYMLMYIKRDTEE